MYNVCRKLNLGECYFRYHISFEFSQNFLQRLDCRVVLHRVVCLTFFGHPRHLEPGHSKTTALYIKANHSRCIAP